MSYERQRVVYEAVQVLQRLYAWGEAGPNFFDCSGLFDWCLRDILPDLPDLWTGYIWEHWEPIDKLEDVQPGDAVLYGSEGDPSHVVMSVTPRARILIGANGGTSYRSLGFAADSLYELNESERNAYLIKMQEREARVQMIYHLWYRDDLLGYRRLPL